MQHGARHGILRANRIGDDGPYVRMRFEQKRNAFNCGSIGPFAALRQALFD